jgi:hypothetical protein
MPWRRSVELQDRIDCGLPEPREVFEREKQLPAVEK